MVTTVRFERRDLPEDLLSNPLPEAGIDRILELELFRGMDPSRFLATNSLRDIVRDNVSFRTYAAGDIVVRVGDYGNTAFYLISGSLRVVMPPGLPKSMLGRGSQRTKGFLEALRQAWNNPTQPEVRASPGGYPRDGVDSRQLGDRETRIFLQDVPAVLDKHRTARLEPGEFFGEIAALGRTPRSATVMAETDAVVVEIRWQGLRDICRRVDDFRHYIEGRYRERSLGTHLRETPMFRHLDENVIEKIVDETLFETYGAFEWHATYKRYLDLPAAERLAYEPVIVRQGDYADDLLLVRSGFVRVSRRFNHGEQTVNYLGRGDVYGFDEISRAWREDGPSVFDFTLRAVGYADVLRVPTSIIEEHVLPAVPPPERRSSGSAPPTPGPAASPAAGRPEVDSGLLEFLVQNRYLNGTATMLINLDRCVRCDACVEACAMAHVNNPRFVRHGRQYDNILVANACMQCWDPICMIGCPTGAIHRSTVGGQILINDETCIGCATCANSCPYDNIRMVEAREEDGSFILDAASQAPVVKATKCDLCHEQLGGPACQRACPHDAMVRLDMRDMPTLASWLNRA
jgi:Fe-S-cluster-containing dehydrogenase component/CRP-like cAMP-binding protein